MKENRYMLHLDLIQIKMKGNYVSARLCYLQDAIWHNLILTYYGNMSFHDLKNMFELLSSIDLALLNPLMRLARTCIIIIENSYLYILWIILSLVSTVRHYEVVYLIHEKHEEEVESVNEKVQGDLCISILLFLPYLYWSHIWSWKLIYS